MKEWRGQCCPVLLSNQAIFSTFSSVGQADLVVEGDIVASSYDQRCKFCTLTKSKELFSGHSRMTAV